MRDVLAANSFNVDRSIASKRRERFEMSLEGLS